MLLGLVWITMQGVLARIIALAVLFLVGLLGLLGCRAWARYERKRLPKYRNVMAWGSIFLLFANWTVLLAYLVAISARIRMPFPTADMDIFFTFLAVLSAALCLAVKHTARIQILIASAILAALWATSVVA